MGRMGWIRATLQPSRGEVGHLYDASVLLCIRALSVLWASPLWGRTTRDTLTWDLETMEWQRKREGRGEREREVERVAHSGKRISLYVWPGSVVYAKRSAHRVTMSAARSGWLRLIIRLHFCTSSTVTPLPLSLFSSRIKLRELGSRPIKFIRACFRGGEKNVAAIQRL